MSGPSVACPDWNGLVAQRERAEADGGAEPAAWGAALDHLDGCPRCRRQALAADPLLVFRRLPGVEMSGAATAEERAEADSETESMIQAVTAMRTAARLESRRRFGGWRRWAAAAVLALVSLSLGRDKTPLLAPQAPPVVALPEMASPAANFAGAATLERLDSSDARVYQLSGKDLSVFMIVDKKLDV